MFGFTDYLTPSLKNEVNKLSSEKKALIGISDWSFETFLVLVYEHAKRFNSIDVDSSDSANQLFEDMISQPDNETTDPLFYGTILDY